MKVYDYTIKQAMIDRVIDRMKQAVFQSADIEQVCIDMGIPHHDGHSNYIAHRAADRLIQRERKAGNIAYVERRWHWVGKEDPK